MPVVFPPEARSRAGFDSCASRRCNAGLACLQDPAGRPGRCCLFAQLSPNLGKPFHETVIGIEHQGDNRFQVFKGCRFDDSLLQNNSPCVFQRLGLFITANNPVSRRFFSRHGVNLVLEFELQRAWIGLGCGAGGCFMCCTFLY